MLTETRVEIQYSTNTCEKCGGKLEGKNCPSCGTEYVIKRTSKTVRAEGESPIQETLSFDDALIHIKSLLGTIEKHLPEYIETVMWNKKNARLKLAKSEHEKRDSRFIKSLEYGGLLLALLAMTAALAPVASESVNEFSDPVYAVTIIIMIASLFTAVAAYVESDIVIEKVFYKTQLLDQVYSDDQLAAIENEAFEYGARWFQTFNLNLLYEYWINFAEELELHQPDVAKRIAMIFKVRQNDLMQLGYVDGIQDLLQWCEQQLPEDVAPVVETA